MRHATIPALFCLLLVACGGSEPAPQPAASGGETNTAPVGVETASADAAPESAPVDETGGPPTTCEGVTCPPGQHCVVEQVQCIRAPCPPLAQCVRD